MIDEAIGSLFREENGISSRHSRHNNVHGAVNTGETLQESGEKRSYGGYNRLVIDPLSAELQPPPLQLRHIHEKFGIIESSLKHLKGYFEGCFILL